MSIQRVDSEYTASTQRVHSGYTVSTQRVYSEYRMAILFTFGRIGTLERLISFSKMAADAKLIVLCAHA